mgnify:CR=1 FL=1
MSNSEYLDVITFAASVIKEVNPSADNFDLLFGSAAVIAYQFKESNIDLVMTELREFISADYN